MAIKYCLGKLIFRLPFEVFLAEQVNRNKFNLLDIKVSHINIISSLPLHHRDPFDRILIVREMVEDIPILSVNAIFDVYPVRRLW